MEFYKIQDESYVSCDESDAEFVMIPRKEYNGLQNALRIVNDRALQQIDKSKADEYGFRFLRGEMRYYRKGRGELYLITKETPYSVKLDVSEVKYLIENKLREIYCWTDQINLQEYQDDGDRLEEYDNSMAPEDVVNAATLWKKPNIEKDDFFWGSSNAKSHAMYNVFSEYKQFIVAVDRISANYGTGQYEVSYWATEII